MANNRVKINCDIDADIGQAKKAINDLQQSIEKLSKAQINTNYLDKGINNAVAAAKELEHHLNVALNQNTGKLNLNAFTSSLEQSNISAKDLMQTLLQGGSAGQQTFASLANAIAQSEVPLRRANKTMQDFATTLKNTVKWEISSTMVHGLESALSGAVSYAKNLNTSLTNIRIVTGQTVEDMARFTKEANAAAKALSTTTKAYADASLIYYQQGDSQEMAAKKAAITIKAANSSFETSAKEMSEYLTSVWNSYQVGADELEHYVDIMANLGAKTATSLEEIATSMQKVAATANTVGVSMEQVSSIIATVSSVTRESAESIGTSYKTIFARIGDLKLGKVDEDGVGLGQVSSQLDAIGIRILDESGNLREMGDIIMDLGNKWQTMNQAQKTAVAQVVAGKRQYTQLMALFENWDMFQGNMNIAENSEGALQKMADIYAESWEAASARVQASMEGIYNKVLNDQAIITITNGIADLIGAVDTLIERLGGMSGTLSTLGGIGINVFSKQIAGGINKTVSDLKTYFSQFSGFGDFVSKRKNGQILNNEQINYQKSLADWDKAIDEVKSKQGEDSPEALALQNSKDLLDMKQQLINAEYSLSDAEKSRAQQLIAQQSAEQERLLSLRQEKESLQKDLNTNANELTSSIVSVERGQGVAASVTRDSLKKLGLEQTIADYTKKSQQSAFANSLASYYDNRKDEYNSIQAQQAAVAELKKQLTDKGIDAHIIDDVNDDLDKALKKVRQIQQQLGDEADSMADGFIDKMDKAGFSQKSRDQASKMFANITDTTGNLVDIEFNEKGVSDTLDHIKEKFNSLFGKDSKLMNSLGDKLTAAAGTLASMQGGFESGAGWIEVWNDETAGFGDHLAAASGILTNLASGFAAGGPWGLALTAVMAIVGGIIQAAEEAEKAYQEAQSQKFEKMQETASKKDEELSNISNLIKNYNTLKETYDTTNTGQDALAESARALAEAYGLVGANILIAEGRFSDFEQMIAQQTGLKNIEAFYQTQIDQLIADVNVADKNSKYNINKSKMIIGDDKTGEFTYFGGGRLDFDAQSQKYGAQYSQSELDFRLMNDITLGYNEAIKARDDAITAEEKYWEDNAEEIGKLTSKIQKYESKRYQIEDENGELQYISHKQFSSGTIKTNFFGGTTAFDAKAIEKGKKDIDKFFSDILSEETEEKITELKEKWATLGTEDRKGRRLVSDTVILNFINEMNEARISLINGQVDSLTAELQTIYDNFDESVLAEGQAKVDSIKTNATEILQSEFSEELKKASGFSEGQTDYYDYFTGLYDKEGRLFFDEQNGDRVAWNNQVKTNLDKLQAEIASIEMYERTEGSPLDKALDARYAELQIYKDVLDSFYNINLTEVSDQLQKWQGLKDQASIINNTIQTMIGRNGTNATFKEFNTWFNQITSSLKQTAAVNDKFKDVIVLDDAEEYGYKIKEGFDEQFNQILNDIASGYISSLTSFDDFLYIYQDLANIFTGPEYQAVIAYMDREGQKISDARLVDSNLIFAMQQDLQNNKSIGENTDRVLAFNQQKLKADQAISDYQSAVKISDSYKEDLNYEDALSLQAILIKEGDKAWENFLAMDADARIAYLESRRDFYLEEAIQEQNSKIKNAQNEMFALYGYNKAVLDEDTQLLVQKNIDAQYQKDKDIIASFQNAGFIKQQDGRYVNNEGIVAENTSDYEAALGRVTGYDAAKKAEEEAEEAKRAFELVAEGEDRAVTKLNRMKAAISELPADMKEFNKLVQQLGNIDPKELINMSNLERAELILNNLEKPQESTFWYEENGEKKFNAAGYAEALKVYEEARSNAINIITQDAEEAFARIETRANQAREEAEKTKAIADTLSSSIDSGYLTETQKLNMSPELISQWESASSAVERGAIAAKMWANYATQITAAGEEMATAYQTAESELNWYINDSYKAFNNSSSYRFSGDNGKINFEDFIRKNVKNPELQSIWNKAFSELAEKTKFTGMSDQAILEAVRAQIGETGDLTEAEFDQIMAGVKDSIVQTYAQLGEQEASLAQQVVDDWESAFRQIADLRRSIIMGEDIGSDLTASLGDYVRYANAYTGEGSLAAAYKSGKLTAEQMALGSDKELTEKLLASMGLSNDGYDLFTLLEDGMHLKGIGPLAKQFGITKDEERFKIDGKFDQKLYENAIREAAKPFLQNLLLQSGMDVTTANQLLSEFMLGSNTAIETINQAANKMLNVSEEYSQLLTDNQKLAEADAAYQKYTEEEKKKQQEFLDYADATEAITELEKGQRTEETIAGILADKGITQADYIEKLQKKGYDVSTLADIGQLSDQALLNIENSLQEDAAQAGRNIIAAGEAFAGIVTGIGANGEAVSGGTIGDYSTDESLGFGKDSIAGKQAQKYVDEGKKALDNLQGTFQEDIEDDYESQLGKYGLNVEDVSTLKEHIQETAIENEKLDDSLRNNANGAAEAAKEISRYNKAVQEASNSYKDWLKELDSGDLDKQGKTIKNLRRTYEDLLDLDYDILPDTFLNSKDNLELMKKAIEGNEQAYNDLQKAAAKAIYKDQIGEVSEEVSNLIDELSDIENIQIGQTVTIGGEGNDLAQQLNTLYMDAYNAAISGGNSVVKAMEIANALIASVGFNVPQLQMETKTIYTKSEVPPDVIPQLGAAVTTDAGSFQGVDWVTEPNPDYPYTLEITYPKQALSFTKSAEGGGGASPKKSGGGGGGQKKKEKKDKLRARDEIERYHTNEKVLESIESTLTEIDKLKDRAYGIDHVKQLDAETAALKEQLKAQQALKEEAESYIPQDRGEFLKYGAQFDADGVITNYKDVMQAIMDEYNQAIERYNNSAQEDHDKERLEDAKQKYDDLKDSIEKYEEAVQKAKDAANEMLEIQNQLSELEVEKITYQLELKVEMNDRDIELLEYYQSKYEDQITKQDEVFNNFMGTAQEYRDNLDALGNAHDELVAKYNAGLINEADYAEAMADLYDQIVDNLSSLNEIQQELVDTYTNTLELARDEVEKTTNTIESANEALQSYMDIIALTGGETDYQKMANFYKQMNENNIIKIEVQRDHLTALLEEEDRFQEKIAAGQELTDLEKEQYAALREEIEDTKDTLLSSTTEALETIRETYENTINGISKELDDFMSGAAASLEHLQEQYGYFQEEQERYVSTARELYEVSKLNRDIEGSIGDATSKAAKEALKALQEKINKQSELNELTEYDIEMNQLQYQLLLARIKLEETQNAKDVVRLTRDDDGNYAYRYTANQDKIDEAAQQYEDILQQINDMTVERTAEIEQRLLDTMASYKEKFTAIATDYTLTEEERLMKLEELSSQFAASMQYIQEQNNIVTDNLAFNQEAIAEHYGTNISAITASTAGNVNEQIQSMIDKTQEYVAKMNEAIFGEEGQLSAWQKYISQIGDVTGAAGTAYEDMLEDAEEMGEMSEWSAEQAQEVIDALEDTLEPLASLSAAWESHNAILQDTISEYETLAELIQGVLAAVGEIPNTTGLGKADGSSHVNKYAKGGIVDYTGLAWVDGTPSDPELMLDAQDTQNILQAATAVKALDSGFIGTLVESVKATAQAMMSMLSGSYHAFSGVHTSNTTLDQNVNITAEFPNVTDHNEIEEALLGLVNRASQFASRKK